MDKTLYVITGPTAVGKTELSLQWAEEHDAEIVSCDAYLVYRGMDIGTAKPSPIELARVPHHLIDLVDASQPFSIKAYLTAAWDVVQDIHHRGKRVLITGGSGFYLKSFFEPVVDDIAHDSKATAEVNALEVNAGLSGLLERLLALNPEGLGPLDQQNPRRVSKALERCLASGKTLLELQAEFAAQQSQFADYSKQVCLLEREPELLWERICQRVDGMFEAGLLDEVKALEARGLRENPSAASAIGYREVLQALASGNSIDRVALAEEIAVNTRKLVAKQRKWFRNQLKADQVYRFTEGETVFD